MAAKYNHAYDDSGTSAAREPPLYNHGDYEIPITSSKDPPTYEIPDQTSIVLNVLSESPIPSNTVQNSPPKNSSIMCRLFLILVASFVIGCVVGGGVIYLSIRQTQDASLEDLNGSAKNVDEVTLGSIFTCPTPPATSTSSCTCPTPDTAMCNFPVCANNGTCEDSDKCSCTACYAGLRCESVLSGISGPLGIQIGSIDMIEDRQMTASSEYVIDTSAWYAHEGRLTNSRYWASWVGQVLPWLQVDFLKPVVITGILTQGAGRIAQWPKSVQVKYGKKSDALQTIMENGLPKNFTANVNEDDVKQIDFPGNYVARYVRVIIVTYEWHPAMRVEVLGYKCG